MAIVKDRSLLNDDESIPIELLSKCLEDHKGLVDRYEVLNNYYDGKHEILNRVFDNENIPNNKIVCNHAQYISDMATGYVFGIPILYTGEGSEEINNIFTEIDEDSHNNELALDISILGVGYELLYMNDEEIPYPELATISPLNSFLVVDNTVKEKPMFGVSYNARLDIDNQIKGYDVNVYTDKEVIHYFFVDLNSKSPTEEDREPHYFNGIPLIEYKNNKKLMGDFEGVRTLIDAYNKLQSDRVNDKEQLVDAFLLIVGQSLGDTKDEVSETVKYLMENKIIELDEKGDARWLVKQLNEEQTEILKKSLKDDIHEFSKVPCLTDENFVGNASGIAMKYKLLGFEQLGKTKERYFKKGLRQRLKLMSNIENIRAKHIDSSKIDIIMKRSLPVDEELLARISQETSDLLSWETRVQRFDSEIDVEEERKKLDEDKKKSIEENQKAFGSYNFKHDIDDKGDDKDEDSSMDSANNS
ncbi:MAG: phage portal protein [Bacillota bacterium]|nr:phage portal protein [Clostridium perfringens]MDU7817288.1 phage portal protein [Bacillota bacterium]DAL65976.1 MAG TPA_asm: PORTAL PROTEIN [Caudoviricetes sp.]